MCFFVHFQFVFPLKQTSKQPRMRFVIPIARECRTELESSNLFFRGKVPLQLENSIFLSISPDPSTRALEISIRCEKPAKTLEKPRHQFPTYYDASCDCWLMLTWCVAFHAEVFKFFAQSPDPRRPTGCAQDVLLGGEKWFPKGTFFSSPGTEHSTGNGGRDCTRGILRSVLGEFHFWNTYVLEWHAASPELRISWILCLYAKRSQVYFLLPFWHLFRCGRASR